MCSSRSIIVRGSSSAYLADYGQIPSLIAAVALTATSIGVSVGMWRQHDALGTPKGQVLTDVAEMDDLSGIALMALLFAIVPILREADNWATGRCRRISTPLSFWFRR